MASEQQDETMEHRLMDFIESQFNHHQKTLKKGTKRTYEYKYKGNAKQAEFNGEILEKLQDLKALLEAGSVTRSGKLLDDIIKDVTKRMKCIKLADRSPGGWDTVKEYLSDELASDSGDEKKMRSAEERALTKRKMAKKAVQPPPLPPPPPQSTFRNDQSSSRQVQFPTGRPSRPTSLRSSVSSASSSDQCFRCGRFGHHRRDCFTRTSASASNKR